MSTVHGIGIVGAGLISERHARACSELPERARLVAIAEIDEGRRRAAADAWSVPLAFASHEDLLACPDVDVVVVATPPVHHERVVVDALRAGRHVICEKPLAHTLAAADRIVAEAERHPGRLSVVHQFRWLPEVRRALWLRDSGGLGRPLFGRFSRYARFARPPKPGRAPKPARRAWWGRWDVAGGGAVMTQLIHELDLMGHLFGPATEVSAVVGTRSAPIESEDTCAATVRFASGAIAVCYGTMCAHRSSHGFDVIGDAGSAHSPWAYESLDAQRRATGRAEALLVAPDAGPDPESAAHTPYLLAVLDAIDAGAPLPVGPDEARAAVELCAAIYASALTGAPVPLPMGPADHFYDGVSAEDYAAVTA